MDETKHPIPPVQKIANCERPDHPIVTEIEAIKNKLFESGQQFFLMGLIFTDEGDGILTQGISAAHLEDPNVCDDLESRLFQEAREMGERKFNLLKERMIAVFGNHEGSGK